MKLAPFAVTLSIALLLVLPANAQESKPADAAASTAPVANPVSSTVKEQLTRFTKIIIAAAESMPAEKYNFKPTPEMNTFAHLTMHIAQGNTVLLFQSLRRRRTGNNQTRRHRPQRQTGRRPQSFF